MTVNDDAYFLGQTFGALAEFAKDDKTPQATRELIFLMDEATRRLLLRVEDLESQIEYWKAQAR